ncbi:MAG TPA: 2Fe-2S iron-sulfur cluster-binding protein [Terriglobales bacterium]|nr:2Fe-2S iron-sulfur cluster-binding protein [Terriglobales bacterium]
MTESIEFHTELYRRDAVETAVRKYQGQAQISLAQSGAHLVASLAAAGGSDLQALRDALCNEAFSATVRGLRSQHAEAGKAENAAETAPPWPLLAPYQAGSGLGLGWVLESLGPVRSGAASLVLRHAGGAIARVAIRRNSGAPLGVAHTSHLDFLLMNGGGGATPTEDSVGRVLCHLAATLEATAIPEEALAALLPHAETTARPARAAEAGEGPAARRLVPQIDAPGQMVTFALEERGISRLELYDALLGFADRCSIFLSRQEPEQLRLSLKCGGDANQMRALAADVTRALNHVVRRSAEGRGRASERKDGLPALAQRPVDLEALLAELETADASTVGLGFEPERGPGHEGLRILNVRGTGACNSECVFCIEKFNPQHRSMPKADATRDFILGGAGKYDMLFFASGEPTIHPKLFEYVDLARTVGFTCFGMSSHFRTFADPRFALRVLQAGFEYFDISLHAADLTNQLEVNPIDDGGRSLDEALKGLAVLYRLADALGIRISVTHKIVVSRLNVTDLDAIFHATYDRGVRHFILQPVRTLGLAEDLQKKLEISEEEILPHLNELLRRTESSAALIKPYGFSRQHLFAGSHVESEQNRVKNIYGKARRPPAERSVPASKPQQVAPGQHWVEIRLGNDGTYGFAAGEEAVLLDQGLSEQLDLPFGCRMGSCGMCCARIVEGEVDQSGQIFLTDGQIEQGFVLLCQAKPRSNLRLRLCSDEEVDQL